MANLVKVNLIENGPRNVHLHVFLQADGAEGELLNYVLINPRDLGMRNGERLRLARIEYNFSGFDARLEFNSGTIPQNFKWVMTEGANAPVDFLQWGLILDNSGPDGSGALMINTIGFTNSNDQGSLLVRLIK